VPPVFAVEDADEVEGLDSRFGKRTMVVQIGAGVNHPLLYRKTQLVYGAFIMFEQSRGGVQKGDGDHLVSPAQHVEVDLPAREFSPTPHDIVAGTVETVGLRHPPAERFFPVKKDEFDLGGPLGDGGQAASQLQQQGGSARPVVRSDEAGNTGFRVDVAADEERSRLLRGAEEGVEVDHTCAVGKRKRLSLHLPPGGLELLCQVGELARVGS